MFLSKLGYSELVQRLFEKMTFSLVDPLTQELAVRLCSAVSRMHWRPPCPTWMTRTDDDDNDNKRWTTQ
jgi:hypothetical protein